MPIRFDEHNVLAVGAERGQGHAMGKRVFESGGHGGVANSFEQERQPLRAQLPVPSIKLSPSDGTSKRSSFISVQTLRLAGSSLLRAHRVT